MTTGLVAFHYPGPDHRDELVQRMRAAAEVMRTVDGCLDASVWEVRESEAIVSTGTFASEETWSQAVRAVLAAGVDFDYDERELRPREVYFLEQPECGL
ncbi:MAG TPA: antibiotic biosynthesis monooxygenase [Gaiellaceae bacterium]|nr:antibiotic biosynthesis monooxygenase [Gaiellaceae bacterium]